MGGLIGCLGIVVSFFRNCIANIRPKTSIAFLHPFCDGCGGGERVLWAVIQGITDESKENNGKSSVVIYSCSKLPPSEILAKVDEYFGILLSEELLSSGRLRFIRLSRYEWMIQPTSYPRLTLMGEAIGSLIFGCICLWKHTPGVFVDTTGLPFTYLPAKFVSSLLILRNFVCGLTPTGIKVCAYVHYPLVSSDMLLSVQQGEVSFNNAKVFRRGLLRQMKVCYYRIIALLYWICGRCCDVVFTNSTWTQEHICSLWGYPQGKQPPKGRKGPRVVYPPFDLQIPPIERQIRQNRIVSVGQFRPEKNQMEQLTIFHRMKRQFEKELPKDLELWICGTSRGDRDGYIIDQLNAEIQSNSCLQGCVKVCVNMPFPELVETLLTSKVALHTMKNEHFGIVLAEFLAAGLVIVAHRSGGPMKDILVPLGGKTDDATKTVGFTAETVEEFAKYLADAIIRYEETDIQLVRKNAIQSVLERFHDNEVFAKQLIGEIS